MNTNKLQNIINQVAQQVNSGNFPMALQSALKWQNLDSSSTDAQYWVSWLQLRLKQNKNALHTILQLINSGASHPTYLILLAECYVKNGDPGLALTTANKIDLKSYDKSNHLLTLGTIFADVGKHQQALDVFSKITDLTPNSITALFQKAVALNHCHKVTEAEETYNRILQMNPTFFRVYFMLSHLKKQTEEDNHTTRWQDVLDKQKNNKKAIAFINLALFKEHEDIGNYSQAFKYLKTANDFLDQTSNFLASKEQQYTKLSKETFSTNFINQNDKGCSSEEPIFILGMPRTGTTLVEQILTTSDEVYSAGELQNFTIELTRLMNNISSQNTEEILQQIKNINFQTLGENYIKSTRPQTGQTKYFIDKMPFNYKLVGAILKALPNAKIIHLSRNPADTCLSNYKQLFETDIHSASYNLSKISEQFACYHQLMKHWEKMYGERIYKIEYEELVMNQKEESRRLIAYCNLPWSDKFLDFHKHITTSSTASVAQIRLPLYNSSINKWHHFKNEMSPALEILTKYNIPYE